MVWFINGLQYTQWKRIELLAGGYRNVLFAMPPFTTRRGVSWITLDYIMKYTLVWNLVSSFEMNYNLVRKYYC